MSYRNTVGPGIDISHYGAPYQGMLGVPGLGAYVAQPGFRTRYDYATAGLGSWSGPPAEDPRMVKQYTVVRSTYAVQNVASADAARAATVLQARARALFPGHTVRKIGTTGWTHNNRIGYEVILASAMRAGEIRRKNFQAGQQAAAAMGGEARFVDAKTTIPANAYEAAPAGTPPTPETTPSATPSQEAGAEASPQVEEGFFDKKVAGLPVWAVGLIGLGVVGGATVLLTRKKKPAPTPNRRRRRTR